MLKQRVLSAVVMALVFLTVLFALPPAGFLIFVTLGTAVAAWEWANLSGVTCRIRKSVYVLVLSVAVISIALLVGFDANYAPLNKEYLQSMLVVSVAWWGVALLWVQGYPSSSVLWGSTPVRLLMGLFVLVPTCIGLFFIRSEQQGSWLVLLVVAIVASADIGAYFTGKRFGRHRLAAMVSPGKSWEGFFGGLVASLILALIVGQLWAPAEKLWMLALVAPTALVSVLGDLLESMVKRHRGVKDSGLILPGHGGVLDRVDGITAAVPVFALTLLVIGMPL